MKSVRVTGKKNYQLLELEMPVIKIAPYIVKRYAGFVNEIEGRDCGKE